MSNSYSLFFDIDHTLFSHTQKKVPSSCMDSLLKLKADGHKIFIATGRHRREMAALDIDWSFYLSEAVNKKDWTREIKA